MERSTAEMNIFEPMTTSRSPYDFFFSSSLDSTFQTDSETTRWGSKDDSISVTTQQTQESFNFFFDPTEEYQKREAEHGGWSKQKTSGIKQIPQLWSLALSSFLITGSKYK